MACAITARHDARIGIQRGCSAKTANQSISSACRTAESAWASQPQAGTLALTTAAVRMQAQQPALLVVTVQTAGHGNGKEMDS
jgi:hypothetical protein